MCLFLTLRYLTFPGKDVVCENKMDVDMSIYPRRWVKGANEILCTTLIKEHSSGQCHCPVTGRPFYSHTQTMLTAENTNCRGDFKVCYRKCKCLKNIFINTKSITNELFTSSIWLSAPTKYTICLREWLWRETFFFIQSGVKKRNIFKIDFLISIFIKIHHIIYQSKDNWMNFMMMKLYQEIFYDKYFIRLWKRPLKNTSHKKCHFQGKRRNSFLLRVERKETRNQNN